MTPTRNAGMKALALVIGGGILGWILKPCEDCDECAPAPECPACPACPPPPVCPSPNGQSGTPGVYTTPNIPTATKDIEDRQQMLRRFLQTLNRGFVVRGASPMPLPGLSSDCIATGYDPTGRWTQCWTVLQLGAQTVLSHTVFPVGVPRKTVETLDRTTLMRDDVAAAISLALERIYQLARTPGA